jgi:hypothetical protein
MIENEYSLLWEATIWEFLFITVILAGGAAYLTGRAVAIAWTGQTQLVVYVFLLTCATRFIHFALFDGTLRSIHYFIVDFVILLIIAFIGQRVTRARQMATQYSFQYGRSGALNWSRKT